MKSPFALLLVLVSASLAFGAIEFSEDQVASDVAPMSAAESPAIEVQSDATFPLGQSVAVSDEGIAPQLVASATGLVPTVEAASPERSAAVATGIAGSGGGVRLAAEGDEDVNSVAQAASAELEAQQGLATPEPSAVVVWVVLATFGGVAISWRRLRAPAC